MWLPGARFVHHVRGAKANTKPTPSAVPDDQQIVTRAVHLSTWLGKPPLAVHRFDLDLQNPTAEAQWVVIPRTFPYAGRDDPKPGGNAAELQVYRLSNRPNALLVEVVGANFQTLRLPPKGKVTLRGLAVKSWWSERPATATLQVALAPRINIRQTTLSSLLPSPVLTATGVSVTAPDDAGDSRALPFVALDDHATTGGKSRAFPVSFATPIQGPLVQTMNVTLDGRGP